jgi:hypothetical protein
MAPEHAFRPPQHIFTPRRNASDAAKEKLASYMYEHIDILHHVECDMMNVTETIAAII